MGAQLLLLLFLYLIFLYMQQQFRLYINIMKLSEIHKICLIYLQ